MGQALQAPQNFGGEFMTGAALVEAPKVEGYEKPIDVKTAARFLGISPSLVYAYVERKQIPHFRMMGRAIRFRLSELDSWRQQFHVNGGING
jgi:excisionase family DNA binding protein